MKKLNIILSIIFVFSVISVFSLDVLAQGKKETSPGALKKATIGKVEKVVGSTVTINETGGIKKTDAFTDSKTQIKGQDKKIVLLKNIKPNDLVAVISSDSGQISTDSAKKATKLFVKTASSSAETKRNAIHGIVSEINGTTLTLVHQVHQERAYTVMANESTLVKIKGAQTSKIANITVGMRIVAIGEKNGENGLLAKMIHVIPGKGVGLLKKSPLATASSKLKITPKPSTPSATPTKVASPSATPVSTSSAVINQ